MSAAYNIFGSAIHMKRHLINLAASPLDALAKRENWITQSCPLAIAVAACSFHNNLTIEVDSILLKSRSWNLSIPNSQLCVLAQFRMPTSFVMMSLSVL